MTLLNVLRARCAALGAVLLVAVCMWALAAPAHAQALDPSADPTDPINVGVAAFNRGHWATAMRAWRPAAEQGNAMAQNNVGYLHEQGLGVPQSYVQAMNWYRRAAQQNEAHAQFNIGNLYLNGYGVERNPREAVGWFRQAARQNLPEGMYMLGMSYYEGVGVRLNYDLALEWLDRSARTGYSPAQMMLAQLHLSGDAGREEPFKAWVWAQVAFNNGQPEAELIRDYASYSMRAADVVRATEAAKVCQSSAYQRCPPK